MGLDQVSKYIQLQIGEKLEVVFIPMSIAQG